MSKENKNDKLSNETNLKSKDKCLYTCEELIDGSEYKKIIKYFPNIYRTYHREYVIYGTIINFIFTTIIAGLYSSLVTALIFFVVYEVIYLILYKVKLEYLTARKWKHFQENGEIDKKINTEFYEDYFIRKSEKMSVTINYSEIGRCVEDNTHFCLDYSQRNMVIIIQKNACDLELINFIRRKFKNLESRLGDEPTFKTVKKHYNPIFIKKFMIVLFVITIASLWGALATFTLVNELMPQHDFSYLKNMWLFWCWSPIPLLSIILGFKYTKAGFKCIKNIVGGFIISFFLLNLGAFCLLPTYQEDYKKIDAYRNIIDVELPHDGKLYIHDWDTNLDEDKTESTFIDAYYDKEDAISLLHSIENSDNWILSKDIKSQLKILIPFFLNLEEDAYFSIYNNTTKEYNALPEIPGNYEIYAMKYDKALNHLRICKFNYLYK